MRIPIVDARADLAVGPIATGAPASDLLLLSPTGAGAELRAHRRLATPVPPGRAVDASGRDVAAAFLAGPASRADLVFAHGDGVAVSWGQSAGALCVVGGQFVGGAPTVTAARLRPGAPDVVVAPVGTGAWTAGAVQALDPTGCRRADWASWPIEVVLSRVGIADRVYPLRLSPTARASGVDDPRCRDGRGAAPPARARAGSGRRVRGRALHRGEGGRPRARGTGLVAARRRAPGRRAGRRSVDVDLDGAPDLIFSLAIWTVVPDVNGAPSRSRTATTPSSSILRRG
jgi:hypothetical protein